MTTVNIHEAKTHLSRLIERATRGETVVIAKAGKAMVRLVPVESPEETARRRLGFMQGVGVAPADIKTAFAAEIEGLFDGKP